MKRTFPCVRCGIPVITQGRACRDCVSVDPILTRRLR